MRKLLVGFVVGILCVVAPLLTQAKETQTDAYVLGRVTIIFDDGGSVDENIGFDERTERVNVKILTGEDAGKEEIMEYTMSAANFETQKLDEGDLVLVTMSSVIDPPRYIVLDTFRLPGVAILFLGFFLLALIFGRLRGVTSIVGLGASLALLIFGVVPAILHGHDPLLVSLCGASVIAVVSILLAHGVNYRSFVALCATLVTLVGAVIFAFCAVWLSGLSGAGTEEALYLQLGILPTLNLQGLLLGGMIIGTLGVLDDVTTAQVAAIEEISLADSSLSAKELYQRGLRVGREHIAALVNTLALAYAGAAFPLFLLFGTQGGPPLWVVGNNEFVMEEVVRALVGGGALILAVPVSTLFAAYAFTRHRRTYAR